MQISCKFVNSENNWYCAIKWGMQLKVGKRYVAQSVWGQSNLGCCKWIGWKITVYNKIATAL